MILCAMLSVVPSRECVLFSPHGLKVIRVACMHTGGWHWRAIWTVGSESGGAPTRMEVGPQTLHAFVQDPLFHHYFAL